jgi:hypothetical protein
MAGDAKLFKISVSDLQDILEGMGNYTPCVTPHYETYSSQATVDMVRQTS